VRPFAVPLTLVRERPKNWWLDVALLAGFVLLTLLLAVKSPLLGFDLAIRDFVDAHRPRWFYWVLRVFNYLGQGGQVLTPLAALTAMILVIRRRSARPLLPVIAAFIATYITIGPLKILTDRAAASSHIQHPEWLFHDPNGLSYPSGHVVNAIVWYGVLALLLGDLLSRRQLLMVRYGAPAIVLFTTTYLSFHWVTDGLGAILVGVVLDRMLRRIPYENIPLGRLERVSENAGR
jgi:membrane-associated phospholipid phosphatase